MKPEEKVTLIKALHAHYNARTTFEMILNPQRERMWWDWCTFSDWTWTCDDLSRVIGYLISQIKIDKRNDGALRFNNLIGQPDKFEEDLALAKKAAKPNQMFVAKPSAVPKPKAGQPINSFGEQIHAGSTAAADFLRSVKGEQP